MTGRASPFPATQRLAAFTAALRYEDLPSAVREQLGVLVVDFFRVAAIGRRPMNADKIKTEAIDRINRIQTGFTRINKPGGGLVLWWAPNYMGAAESRSHLETQHASQKAILTELGLAK